MILTLHFWNGKKVEIVMTVELVMQFIEAYQQNEPQVYAFTGSSGHNVYVPSDHINFFEVKDVPEELPESA